MKRSEMVLVVLGLLALAAAPFGSDYSVRLVTETLMYAALAISWDLIGGLCGYASFGNAAFVGAGAYTVAVLMNDAHWSLLPAVLAGGLVAALLGFLVGLPVLRLRGHYFSIATLGVAVALQQIVSNIPALGSGNGVTLPLSHHPPAYFLFLMAGALAVAIAIGAWSIYGPWGYAFLAIREDETAARVSGVNTTLYKEIAWTLSSLIGGLVGGIWAYWVSYIDPPTVFDPLITVSMLVMAILGGRGTLLGPILGAVILQTLANAFWAKFPEVHSLMLGVAVVLAVLLVPTGLMPFIRGEKKLSAKALLEHIRMYGV